LILTPQQQEMLDGKKGETMAKIMKTLVMYGEAFDAQRMVPITSEYGHTVISFGIGVMKPVYELYDQLVWSGAKTMQKFTADPLPMDKNVPSNLLQDIVFKFMYSQQERYEEQLRELGILREDAYTCACYLPQIGNTPKKGEILSWAESSAVVYANRVLGARCKPQLGYPGDDELHCRMCAGVWFLTDEGRKADWIIEVRLPENRRRSFWDRRSA